MFEGFAQELERDVRGYHAQLRALTATDSSVELQRRVRIADGLARAAKSVLQLDKLKRDETRPREGDGEDMRLPTDPDIVERKHRVLDAGLDRIARQLQRTGAAERDVPVPPGNRAEQLACEGQPRAA